MDIQKYLKMPNAVIPEDIAEKISKPGNITCTEFDERESILFDRALQAEVGFAKMPNEDYLVAMTCPMPRVTAQMVQWWFWWHPQKNERYQAWYPGEHYENSYADKDRKYFEAAEMPPFQRNTQYPIEKIGGIRMPLRIDFVTPEEFGFSRTAMEENGVAAVVCGHVSAFNDLVSHTEMAHIFFEDGEGLHLISRFWIGKRMKNKILRKVILNDNMARGMAEHCCVEYRNLAERLPEMYKNYK